MGRRPKTPAQHAQTRVVLQRANCFADWLDELGWRMAGYQDNDTQPLYDFTGEILPRWRHGNGVYRPEYEFVRRRNAGEYAGRFGKEKDDADTV